MNRIFFALALLVIGSASHAQQPGSSQLDFLAGHWTIEDMEGAAVGTADIVAQVPGTMLYEERRVGDGGAQPLWLENAERNNGWTQLFVNPLGQIRQFVPRSEPGAWPIVMAADVTLQDGTPVTFRLTMTRESDDESRRLLEMSPDDGTSWRTVFDYRYLRSYP